MRILCVCDHGSNRSVHVADQLRWRGHETIPVAAQHLGDETRQLLADWCELAIFTGPGQRELFPGVESLEWLLPENPRPYNPDTLRLVRVHIANSDL
jgi:hypothetical protein